MTSKLDPQELERLIKAAEQEDDDVRYYGGPTSTHRPARDAYHAALVQLHRTGQLVPAMPSGDVVGVIGVLDPCGGTFADMVETAQEQMILEKAGNVRMPETCEDIVRRLSEDPCSCGVMYRAMTCLPCRCKAAITTYEAVSGVAKMREEGVKIGLEAAANAIQAIVDHAPNGSLGRELQPIVALLSCLDPAAIARAALGEKP